MILQPMAIAVGWVSGCALGCGVSAVSGLSGASCSVAETIADVYSASDTPYLIVNEDHDADGHREFSACLLDHVANIDGLIVGVEAFPNDRPFDRSTLAQSGGYTGSRGFQEILRVIDSHELFAFGYDPARDDQLNDQDLAELGLLKRTPNRRDRVAARRIETIRAQMGASKIYLHVGHAHVSERWTEQPDGAYGWLAAHLAQLSETDPLTVNQMTPDRARWYLERGRFRFDLDICPGRSSEWAVIMGRREGVIGCVERRLLQAGEVTDYIILDEIPVQAQ